GLLDRTAGVRQGRQETARQGIGGGGPGEPLAGVAQAGRLTPDAVDVLKHRRWVGQVVALPEVADRRPNLGRGGPLPDGPLDDPPPGERLGLAPAGISHRWRTDGSWTALRGCARMTARRAGRVGSLRDR